MSKLIECPRDERKRYREVMTAKYCREICRHFKTCEVWKEKEGE